MIAVARRAIKKAVNNGTICAGDISGMHRVGIEAIRGLCSNIDLASELAWEAVKDLKLSR
jgi:hypothetical protein